MEKDIKLEQVPYARDLNLILNYLKLVFPDFPHKQCQDSTRLVTKVLGLREMAGIFDELPYDNRIDWHAWNYDPQRKLFIDLTARQFNENLPEILVVPKTDERFVVKLVNTRNARSQGFNYCERSFLKDYYIYAKNPDRFYMDGRKKIIRDLTPVSLELAASL